MDTYEQPKVGAQIVDVRHPEEIAKQPLVVEGQSIEEIPYFRIQKEFADMDPKTTYLLYCDRGVMSRLHAELLIDSGHHNVAVYRP